MLLSHSSDQGPRKGPNRDAEAVSPSLSTNQGYWGLAVGLSSPSGVQAKLRKDFSVENSSSILYATKALYLAE